LYKYLLFAATIAVLRRVCHHLCVVIILSLPFFYFPLSQLTPLLSLSLPHLSLKIAATAASYNPGCEVVEAAPTLFSRFLLVALWRSSCVSCCWTQPIQSLNASEHSTLFATSKTSLLAPPLLLVRYILFLFSSIFESQNG